MTSRKLGFGLAAAIVLAAGAASAQTPAKTPAAAHTSATAAAQTGDRLAGYYYPTPNSTETYESQLQTIAGTERAQRIQFTTVVSQGTLQSPYRVPYAVFAKGDAADRLIIVGLVPGEMSTIYRMRGVLSNMTTQARTSPFLQERTVAEDVNFFDLLKLLGFRQVTITDGDKLTHQVTIK
jgi:hypothetical protein